MWLVGLMWMDVISWPLSTLRSTSRKVAVVGDMEWVNFSVEALLRSSRKVSRDSLPCCHIIKMSSMNLRHKRGWYFCLAKNSVSVSPMVRLAYEGAILVPMAVPHFCS